MVLTQEVVKKFGMGEAKVASTPFEHGSEMRVAEAPSFATDCGPKCLSSNAKVDVLGFPPRLHSEGMDHQGKRANSARTVAT